MAEYIVGMLLPFVCRDIRERGLLLRTIGPVWDGNEVWLLVAGGATFAAFPGWYASLFSGFYLALFLLLLGLIVRGIAIERFSAPSSVTRMSSSMRTPMPRSSSGTVRSSGWK